MSLYQPSDIISKAISNFPNYCEGYFGQSSNYLLALNIGIGKAKKRFSHLGSKTLDHINAFDLAEIDGANLGQTNMIVVSSFCGPNGAILGYDFLKAPEEKIFTSQLDDIELPVYNGWNLIQATQKLLGTVEQKKYPVMPGSHLFCATKNIKIDGPAHIYSAIGLGIAKERSKDACLLMEDVGIIPNDTSNFECYKNNVLENLAKSLIQVGINQSMEFIKCFVAIKSTAIAEGEVGCALVAAPYFLIAGNALNGKTADFLVNTSLSEWN